MQIQAKAELSLPPPQHNPAQRDTTTAITI
jgi:hypothetical protein